MKLKLQLDKASVQKFFIENVEKIVFGIAALVFLLLVYSAIMGVERFPDSPEKLRQAVQNGERTVAGVAADSALEVKDYEAQAKQSRVQIKGEPYANAWPWDPPLFQKPEGRPEPALLAVEKLRGSAGAGAFNMVAELERPAAADDEAAAPARAAPMGAKVGGQRWIVITGCVPYESQAKAYADLGAFGPTISRNPQRDTPMYLGYYVERVEVDSEAAKPDWTKAKKIMSREAIAEARKKFGIQGFGEDKVDHKFLAQPDLVFPLPPSTTPWTDAVAHGPEIPFLRDGMGAGPMLPPRAAPAEDKARAADPANPWGRRDEALPAMPNPTPDDAMTKATHLLFRFLDFDVVPGKHYAYHVQLVLNNPNQGLQAAWLQDAKLAKPEFLLTKWSDEESPAIVVSVPRGTRVLAASVKAVRDPSERSGEVMVVKWLRKKGIEASEIVAVGRGQVLNYHDKVFKIIPTGAAAPGPAPMPAPTPMPRPGAAGQGAFGPPPGAGLGAFGPPMAGPGNYAPPGGGGRGYMPPPGNGGRGFTPAFAAQSGSVKVNYLTHAIALDFRGGEPFRGRRGSNAKLTAVGYVLVLNSDGTLSVRSEADDEPARKQLQPPKAEAGGAGGGTPRPPRGLGDFGEKPKRPAPKAKN
jgi:hypothetical protein